MLRLHASNIKLYAGAWSSQSRAQLLHATYRTFLKAALNAAVVKHNGIVSVQIEIILREFHIFRLCSQATLDIDIVIVQVHSAHQHFKAQREQLRRDLGTSPA